MLNPFRNEKNFPYMGKKVVVVSYDRDIYYGRLIFKKENEILLENARYIHEFYIKGDAPPNERIKGDDPKFIGYSGIALFGIERKTSVFSETIKSIYLNVTEIIPCTDESIRCMDKLHKPSIVAVRTWNEVEE
jgi:hypothetical protein